MTKNFFKKFQLEASETRHSKPTDNIAVAAAIFHIQSMETENVKEFDCKKFVYTFTGFLFFSPRFNILSAAPLSQFLIDSLMCCIFYFHMFIPDGRGELWSRALARYEANTVYVPP